MLRKPLGSAKPRLVLRRLPRVWGNAGAIEEKLLGEKSSNDLKLLISADCEDVEFTSLSLSSSSSSLLTTSAEVVPHTSEAILNHINTPLLVPLLTLLYRRGAFLNGNNTSHNYYYDEIVRFLVPAIHRDKLPWFWNNKKEVSDVIRGDISGLRLLSPLAWRSVIERGKPVEPNEKLHYWHQLFFALSNNPAFTDTETFNEAHKELLIILQDYYRDVIQIQEMLPPLEDGTIVTRIPPVFVRKLRKLYVERYCLMQYAELFRAIVDGEELVMPNYGTALLNDTEVFEYYLTIPGRRESGMERDTRWVSTLEYSVFSFQKLFRLQYWKGETVNNIIARSASLLMNVCVFAKNDNAEGERFREAILTIMRVFYSKYGGDDSFYIKAFDVLRVLRDAGVESMIAKCKRLHFGPIRGLLDVCTVATVTEMLLFDDDDDDDENSEINDNKIFFDYKEMEILLSQRKIVGNELYDATKSYGRRHRFAARYGIFNLSPRIISALQSIVLSPVTMQRYTGELTKWGEFIGRPLRLNIFDIPSKQITGSSQLLLSNSNNNNHHYHNYQLENNNLSEKSISTWKCGCYCLNPVQATNSVSCFACVSRDLVEHQWTCPYCNWVSKSGDPIEFCLSCHRPHPRLNTINQNDTIHNLNSDNLNVTPFLWYCEFCSSFSTLDCNGNDITNTCLECNSVGVGWSTGYFEWCCGCGEINSPLRRWCKKCSLQRKYACCMCEVCGKEWLLQPRNNNINNGSNVNKGFNEFQNNNNNNNSDNCPSCSEPHPRMTAACQRRLLRCPFCYSLTPGEAEACVKCNRTIGVLKQFLARLPDWPWVCHVCGRRNHFNNNFNKNNNNSDNNNNNDKEKCEGCGALQIDPVMFNMHEPWHCSECLNNNTNNNTNQNNNIIISRGFNCPSCLSLHPAVPPREAHAWRCLVCYFINNSWNYICQRPGCGTRRAAVLPTPLLYNPWRCPRCEKYSRTSQLPQCEHCNFVRVSSSSSSSSLYNSNNNNNSNMMSDVGGVMGDCTMEEKRLRRLAEVEAILLKSANAEDNKEEDEEEKTRKLLSGFIAENDDWTQHITDSLRLSIPLG